MTHLQQILASGFLLLFGVLSLGVWRRTSRTRRDRPALAWGMTSAYFIVGGGYSTGHALFAAASGVLGYTSPFGRWVGGWVITANLSRGVLSVIYALLVLAVMLLHRRAADALVRRAVPGLLALAVVVTALTSQVHVRTLYGLSTGLAVLSMLTAVALMGALLAAVLNDGMDQLLWISLSLYALKETMSVSLFAVLAWWSITADREAWHIFYWGAAVLAACMSGVAWRRLRLAGQGRRVPALFERMYTLRRAPVS